MKLIKEDKRGRTYHIKDNLNLLYRNVGSISGDNDINAEEVIYFVTGSAIVTIADQIIIINSPQKITIPEKTYHKIEAITDISFILFLN